MEEGGVSAASLWKQNDDTLENLSKDTRQEKNELVRQVDLNSS